MTGSWFCYHPSLVLCCGRLDHGSGQEKRDPVDPVTVDYDATSRYWIGKWPCYLRSSCKDTQCKSGLCFLITSRVLLLPQCSSVFLSTHTHTAFKLKFNLHVQHWITRPADTTFGQHTVLQSIHNNSLKKITAWEIVQWININWKKDIEQHNKVHIQVPPLKKKIRLYHKILIKNIYKQ